ncbi:MAG: SIR2 family protein [Actinomycetota bacterium]
MSIDETTGLAFALNSQPGVFAVLIGSGVSRAADIPTGWGMTLNLVERLAAAEGAEAAGNPEGWYEAQYEEPVGFSTLIERLAPTPSDRRALVGTYIEPLPDQANRTPTTAHRRLAALAKRGSVKVFVTTNFDRLLEQALSDVGIEPLVVATDAQAKGAPALQHAGVVVLKPHGDYLDPSSMRVTEAELAGYPEEMTRLLERTFEDYGLIVAGWSGDWDPALSAAMEASRSRRYPFYFAARGALSDRARQIVASRQGISIAINDADGFFADLDDKVAALAEFERQHPLDDQVLAARTKQALTQATNSLEVDEIFTEETTAVVESLVDSELFPQGIPGLENDAASLRTLADLGHSSLQASSRLCLVAALIGTYGEGGHAAIIERALGRLHRAGTRRSDGLWTRSAAHLRLWPLAATVYAMGVASLSRGNGTLLERALAMSPLSERIDLQNRLDASNLAAVFPGTTAVAQAIDLDLHEGAKVGGDRLQGLLSNQGGRDPAPSLVMCEFLRGPLRHALPDREDYDEAFDDFEVLRAAVAWDGYQHRDEETGPWLPHYMGRFQRSHTRQTERAFAGLVGRLERMDPTPIPSLFGGSVDRCEAAFAAVEKAVAETFPWRL